MKENFDAKGAAIVNADQIETLRKIAENIGGRFRIYSGRGMFGAECAAIYCDDDDECIEEAASLGIKGARRDRLGLGYVVYWPGISTEGVQE